MKDAKAANISNAAPKIGIHATSGNCRSKLEVDEGALIIARTEKQSDQTCGHYSDLGEEATPCNNVLKPGIA